MGILLHSYLSVLELFQVSSQSGRRVVFFFEFDHDGFGGGSGLGVFEGYYRAALGWLVGRGGGVGYVFEEVADLVGPCVGWEVRREDT